MKNGMPLLFQFSSQETQVSCYPPVHLVLGHEGRDKKDAQLPAPGSSVPRRTAVPISHEYPESA